MNIIDKIALGAMAVGYTVAGALLFHILTTPAAAQTQDPLLYTKATTTMRSISIVCGLHARKDHLSNTFERAVIENGGDVERTVYVIKIASDAMVETVRTERSEKQFCDYAVNLYNRIYGQ